MGFFCLLFNLYEQLNFHAKYLQCCFHLICSTVNGIFSQHYSKKEGVIYFQDIFSGHIFLGQL